MYIETKSLSRLSEGGKQSYAKFSPDGTKVAFARDNNLYFVNLINKQEVQVTNDGKFNEIINGSTDWVYEEEFSFVVGFYWSPNGEKLAYYRFDETAVKEYNMQVWAGRSTQRTIDSSIQKQVRQILLSKFGFTI